MPSHLRLLIADAAYFTCRFAIYAITRYAADYADAFAAAYFQLCYARVTPMLILTAMILLRVVCDAACY